MPSLDGYLVTSLNFLHLHSFKGFTPSRLFVKSMHCDASKISFKQLEDVASLSQRVAFRDVWIRNSLLLSGIACRITEEDMLINGFEVPKGTFLYLSFFTLHNSDQYWDHPQHFNPNRWLSASKDSYATAECPPQESVKAREEICTTFDQWCRLIVLK